MFYSLDFSIAQLEQNPAADAVVNKYVPAHYLHGMITFLSPADLSIMKLVNPDKSQAMAAELAKIPVE
jgi:hypothetical protein